LSSLIVHENAETRLRQRLLEDGEGNLTLHTQQDVTDIVEANKAALNATDKHAKWGEMTRVASIPLSIFYSPEFQKISKDPAALKRWLNDPENAAFRTRGGQV